MKNFKKIAEKCLAGELSGTFKNRQGDSISSELLCRSSSKNYPYVYCGYHGITVHGDYYKSGKLSDYDIINFVPDNMQEQIKIDIPEGKVPVMEQTENGVVITWKEKAETYADVESQLKGLPIVDKYINVDKLKEGRSKNFYKKVEVLRKLTNIRNYFGGDKPTNSWLISIDSAHRFYAIENPRSYRESCFIYFDTKEHAEQAIKMLGDELKYLFEPW